MHLPRETTTHPNTSFVWTFMPKQAFCISALKPRPTWRLACDPSPSFKPFSIKLISMDEFLGAVLVSALSQNVIRITEFFISLGLHE